MPTADPPADRRSQRRPQRPGVPRAALAVVLAAYALLAATTTAFTASANIVTALPIVAMVVLVLVLWPLRARPLTLGPDAGHPWRAWIIVFSAVVAWELAEYAARGSRADHPTFSSMLDAVDRFYGLKAVVFFLWLYLGAAIVRRGGRRQRRARRAAS